MEEKQFKRDLQFYFKEKEKERQTLLLQNIIAEKLSLPRVGGISEP